MTGVRANVMLGREPSPSEPRLIVSSDDAVVMINSLLEGFSSPLSSPSMFGSPFGVESEFSSEEFKKNLVSGGAVLSENGDRVSCVRIGRAEVGCASEDSRTIFIGLEDTLTSGWQGVCAQSGEKSGNES